MKPADIIVLLATIPLSIIGTLLAPVVKNWLALLSTKATAQRIKVLESQLKELDKDDVFGFLRILFLLLLFLSGGLLFFMIATLAVFQKLSQFFVYLSYGLFGLACGFAGMGLQKLNQRDNPKYRAKLEEQIALLKSKL